MQSYWVEYFFVHSKNTSAHPKDGLSLYYLNDKKRTCHTLYTADFLQTTEWLLTSTGSWTEWAYWSDA